ACCIPSSAPDHTGLIALCILNHTSNLSKSLRQYLVGVGIPLVNLTLAILSGLDGVIKGSEYLLWGLYVLNGDRTDLNPGFIAIQDGLCQLLHLRSHISTPGIQYKVHGLCTNHLAHGSLHRLANRLIRITRITQIIR